MRHENDARELGRSPSQVRPARIWAVVAAFAVSSSLASTEPADLVLTGGQVFTPGGWQEALAVRDGIIVAVGRVGDVAAYRGPQTAVVELNGRAVFPGLHDMHVHSFLAGMEQFKWRRLRC